MKLQCECLYYVWLDFYLLDSLSRQYLHKSRKREVYGHMHIERHPHWLEGWNFYFMYKLFQENTFSSNSLFFLLTITLPLFHFMMQTVIVCYIASSQHQRSIMTMQDPY